MNLLIEFPNPNLVTHFLEPMAEELGISVESMIFAWCVNNARSWAEHHRDTASILAKPLDAVSGDL